MGFMVFLIILLLFLIVTLPLGFKRKPTAKSDKCPPHSWIYKKIDEDTEYMVCSDCKMLPGGMYEEK